MRIDCPETAASCHCNVELTHEGPHEGPHVCDCGGSWTGSYEGDDFRVVALPGLFEELFS